MITNQQAMEKMNEVLCGQQSRVEAIRAEGDFLDFSALPVIRIGICGGDGIGPMITKVSEEVLRFLLAEPLREKKVEFVAIEDFTLENRLSCGKAIPDDIMAKLKSCHVILKGPTTTPDASFANKNIESANVAMRRELDLFANLRPVKVPEEGIEWMFFRENSEGAYALGMQGFEAANGVSVDFTITTTDATLRIAKLAFDYAKRNGKTKVAVVTKANVIKETDGKFLRICMEVAKEYPGITAESWYADIMTAKLVDKKRRNQFEVLLLPNLYGDIISDEAAEFMGGVGTAGSANVGKRYAMFEAIHGSAVRMVEEGRGQYADPCSMLRASAMLLNHIGYVEESKKLENALDFCMFQDKKITVTGRDTGATSAEYGQYVMDSIAK